MSVVLKSRLTEPSVWKGTDFNEDKSWIYTLTFEDIDSIDRALNHVKRKNLSFPNFTRHDFDVGCFATKINQISIELESGRGFALLKGLQLEHYSEADIQTLYFGLGLHMGSPVKQNTRGDILGEVMNIGDIAKKDTRVYETNAYLPYHTDPSDVVGLLCLRKARSGGLSSLVSATSIHNQILDKYPEYLSLFYKSFYYAHLGEDLPSLSPLFSFYDGKLSCRYLRQYIELGHEIRKHPLSTVEIEALDIFDSIANQTDLRMDMMLQPGDIQFVNNYFILHSRSEFEDHDDLSQRRKLLRLWLKMPNARQLASDFPGRNGFS